MSTKHNLCNLKMVLPIHSQITIEILTIILYIGNNTYKKKDQKKAKLLNYECVWNNIAIILYSNSYRPSFFIHFSFQFPFNNIIWGMKGTARMRKKCQKSWINGLDWRSEGCCYCICVCAGGYVYRQLCYSQSYGNTREH